MKSLLPVAALCLVTLATGCSDTVTNWLDGDIEVDINGDRRELNTGDTETWDRSDLLDFDVRVFVDGELVANEEVEQDPASRDVSTVTAKTGWAAMRLSLNISAIRTQDAIVRSFRRSQFERATCQCGDEQRPGTGHTLLTT